MRRLRYKEVNTCYNMTILSEKKKSHVEKEVGEGRQIFAATDHRI